MRLPISSLSLALLAAGGVQASDEAIVPGDPAVGKWVSFFTRDYDEGEHLEYFYDESKLTQIDRHVIARWKMTATGSKTTLYVIDINCAAHTATEKGTIIIKPDGTSEVLAKEDLFVDFAVEEGSSTDAFSKKFCGKQAG